MTDEKKTFAPVQRTIAVYSFPYFETIDVGGKPHRVRRTARRGDTVTLTEEADVTRGDNNHHFVKDGESVPEFAKPLSLYDLGLLTDEQLEAIWDEKRPPTNDALDAVGEDPELAQRVLDVEKASDRPRSTLISKLESITGKEND